jgi:hypothetical protein
MTTVDVTLLTISVCNFLKVLMLISASNKLFTFKCTRQNITYVCIAEHSVEGSGYAREGLVLARELHGIIIEGWPYTMS